MAHDTTSLPVVLRCPNVNLVPSQDVEQYVIFGIIGRWKIYRQFGNYVATTLAGVTPVEIHAAETLQGLYQKIGLSAVLP